jgi:putative acetyltransferase
VHAASFPTPVEARLVDLLRAAGRLRVSLVAEIGNVIVGHIAFSPVAAASTAAGAGLAPIAVIEAHRRRGVAADLVRKGLDACRQAGVGWVVVLGDPAYYARFGFRAASEFGLRDDYGGGDAFQAVELIRGALPVGAGLVRYSEEFAALGV